MTWARSPGGVCVAFVPLRMPKCDRQNGFSTALTQTSLQRAPQTHIGRQTIDIHLMLVFLSLSTLEASKST